MSWVLSEKDGSVRLPIRVSLKLLVWTRLHNGQFLIEALSGTRGIDGCALALDVREALPSG